MTITTAYAEYIATKQRAGQATDGYSLSTLGAEHGYPETLYRLHNGNLYPITLGNEAEAIDGLVRAAEGIRASEAIKAIRMTARA